MQDILKTFFGFHSLRQDQVPIVDSVRKGIDTFGVMTTGGGKSLCYQAPALERYLSGQGATVVISPLISLMDDQVRGLNEKGIKAERIHHGVSSVEKFSTLRKLVDNQLALIYLSPETLATEAVNDCIKQSRIASFVIDEAHCVSTWGQSFRPAYLRLKNNLDEIESFKGTRLQRCAFTATAKQTVIDDVIDKLGLLSTNVIKHDPDRSNINFSVSHSHQKLQDTLRILSSVRNEPTIVYCNTIANVTQLTTRLKEKGYAAEAYHGRIGSNEKTGIQERFLNNETTVLVATKAFGMGVDKPDVRNVIHFSMPGSIEDYYQEAGRAGRDGLPSTAHLIYSAKDRNTHDYFNYWTFPNREVIEEVNSVVRSLTNDGPISITSQQLAAACHTDIDTRHAESAIRILFENGVIDMEQEIGNPNFRVDYTKHLPIDFDLIDARKKLGSEKLNFMESYAKSSDCKRKFILKYFEAEKSCDHCGNCSSCLEKSAINTKVITKESENKIRGIIIACKDSKGKLETAINILKGVKSSRMERRGYTQSKAFGFMGRLEYEDIKSEIAYLSSKGILTIGDTIEINSKAVQQLFSKPQINSEILDIRKKVAADLKLPEFMIFTDNKAIELTNSAREIGVHRSLINSDLNDRIKDSVNRNFKAEFSYSP